MSEELISTEVAMTEIAALDEGTAIVEPSEQSLAELAKEAFTKERLIKAAILLLVAVVSATFVAGFASEPASYESFNSTLDEKKYNVMALATTTTAASAAISLLPNNAGAPIAEKLVDFSSYFMVVLAVIYLEKFLMTTLGLITFRGLVPAACLLFIAAIFMQKDTLARANILRLGAKLAAFGIAIALVVPTSVLITENIDNSFEASLSQSNEAIQSATQELEESVSGEDDDKGQNWFDSIVGTVQSGFAALTSAAQNALDGLGNQLNNLIDTLAVMIVTSCLIPIIVLFIFLQLAKMVASIDVGGVSAIMSKARQSGRKAYSAMSGTIRKTKKLKS